MKLAFCLFKYFPYGGLQRDFMHIAQECMARGHEIHVYAHSWQGEVPPGFNLHLLRSCGWQNHSVSERFVRKLQGTLRDENYDLTIGFNKMPGLDFYFAADICYKTRIRKRSLIYRLTPRVKHWLAFEETVFAEGNKTQILLISAQQKQAFIESYRTEEHRFHLLPPGVAKDRLPPANVSEIRNEVRRSHGCTEKDFCLLMIGSGFATKGLDRIILGLAALPATLKSRTKLLVIGDDRPQHYLKLGRQYQVADQIRFLGGRSDIPSFLWSADLLVHPAYHENTGTVLLEAIATGLPVLTTENCGYAHYIRDAGAGVVLKSPFQQPEFNAALEKMLLSEERDTWRQNGLNFAAKGDIFSMASKAADIIDNA